MSEHQKRDFRFEFLDALRGMAILMVMLLHFGERGRESGDMLVFANLWPVMQHGYLGVQLFFVVSGYCITAAVYSGFEKQQSVWLFLKRRAHRIFPPYWASIVLVILLGCLTMMILHTPQNVVFPLAPWEWVANIALIQGPLQAQDSNLVYWSLSIEIQFYILMAVCVLLGRRLAEYWILLVTVAAVILGRMHSIPLTGWIMNYWLEFASGIAAFYWITKESQHHWTPWLLVLLTSLAVALGWNDHDSFTVEIGRLIPSLKLLFCLACCLTMVLTYTQDRKLRSLLLCQWLAAAGTISYSLYLTHVPIGTRVFNLGERLTGLSGQKWLFYSCISIIVTLGFGIIFYYICERPWLNTRPARSTSVAASELRTAQNSTTAASA